ncbi:hypothetical protein D3C76_1545480 [compost metagenome]
MLVGQVQIEAGLGPFAALEGEADTGGAGFLLFHVFSAQELANKFASLVDEG